MTTKVNKRRNSPRKKEEAKEAPPAQCTFTEKEAAVIGDVMNVMAQHAEFTMSIKDYQQFMVKLGELKNLAQKIEDHVMEFRRYLDRTRDAD